MLNLIKTRCGIAEAVTVYDTDINTYIEDCKEDMTASGVPKSIITKKNSQVLTAITLYVKAYLGNDRTDTEKYLKLYQKKVFRLTLEEDQEVGTDVE